MVSQPFVAGYPASCVPPQEASNKLASKIAKVKKATTSSQRTIKPFPYVEVAEFLPYWAQAR